MEFRILGSIEVVADGTPTAMGSPLQRRLLAVLLVHARTVVSADRLVDILWGEHPPASAMQSLWTCVARLRHALRVAARTTPHDVLLTRAPGYLLAVEPDQIDAGLFERLVSDASLLVPDRPRAATATLDEALRLWRGPALVEFADTTFASAEAARLDELRLVAIEHRFDADLVLGAHAGLVGELRSFTTEHPLRERPRAQLMLSLYRCGRQAEALEDYRTYRDLLDEELGLEPSSPLRSRQGEILRQSPELDWRPPPPEMDGGRAPAFAAQDSGKGAASDSGVPMEATSFVGRQPDIAAAATALVESRLVTLTGVGGVGKTRLAMQVVAAASSRFADGLSWCELAPVSDPAAVAPALATSLGVRRQPGTNLADSVVVFLASKRLLLVFDNCEHLLDGVRPLLEEILRECPGVSVLTTSRTRLAVVGEHVRPVAPLPLPETAHPPDATAPAVALFIDRAWAVRPDLRLGEENLARIVDLCRQLDGLPLAIELAAARIRSLNPADLSDRMSSPFDLLTTAGGVQSERHGTLRAVLDWSYGLLSPAQRRLFDRLSVFAGTFDLVAAEDVCSGEGIEHREVIDLLATLVDASMINVGPTEGMIRYSLLETLRHYGSQHLRDNDEYDVFRFAHGRHYALVAERADEGLRGPDEARWVTIVDRDVDNLRAAHRWLIEVADADLALRLSRGLRYYMLLRFRDEVVSWGEASLGLPGAEEHRLYAEVCGAVGEGMTARGEMGLATGLAERALAQATGPEDGRRMFGLRVSGMVALYVGRLDDGFHDHEEMLRLARLHHDTYEAGMALLGLAQSRTYAGDPEGGLAFAEEQYRVVEPLGNPSMLAMALYDRAEALSSVDPSRAVEPYKRAIHIAESAGSTFLEGIALVGLASLLGRSGEPDTALPLFRSIIVRWNRMGIWQNQWTTLRNLAQLFVRTGDRETAAVLLGAINARSTTAPAFGTDADLVDSATHRLEDALGPSRWMALSGRGAAMSGNDAVVFACDAIDRAAAPTG